MKLFEPISIRSMRMRNRILMPAMATGFGIRNAVARGYYVERAKGGVGAIVVAAIPPDALANDEFTDGFYKWIGGPVQKYGAKIGPQLWYSNRYPGFKKGEAIQEYVAPSPGVPAGTRAIASLTGDVYCYCRQLTVSEIQDIISRYAKSAQKAKQIGFDFVELHGSHGHNLCYQFFW